MRGARLAVLLALYPLALSAQSSQFGIRGLGLPGRGLSTRSIASGGAFGLFDAESSLNPAALGVVNALSATITINNGYRTLENPAGTATNRDTRFPHFMVQGPIRQTGAALGFSYSNYTSRDFTLISSSTIDLRGVPVEVADTLQSRGGLSDLRLAGAYRVRDKWLLGGAFHVLTGSNRLESHRSFPQDSSYVSSVQRAEISFAGAGVSAGAVRQFGSQFAVAAMARWDGDLGVDRDSARVATIDLPYTFAFGMRWLVAPRLDLASQGIYRTWSAANSDLLEQGGVGSENTLELSFGGEYITDVKQPFSRPIRFGARYGQLPFPLAAGAQPHEVAVSLGSGIRFAQQRGGIDVALEHMWRSEDVFSERGFILSFGISVRP